MADSKFGRGSFIRNALPGKAMVHFIRLHHVLCIFVALFDRLKLLQLLRVEPTIVCCHVFLIRVILPSSQQPLDRRLRAITISVRTPSRLVAAMKPLAVARCAVASEYLRRRKHQFYDATNRPRPEHHVELLGVTFESMPIKESRTDQILIDSSDPSTLSVAKEDCRAETIGARTVTLDKISTATMCHRNSSLWKPTPTRERISSAVLVALQLNANKCAPISPKTAEPDDQDAYLVEPLVQERDTVTKVSPDLTNHEYQVMTALRFPPTEDDCASRITVPSSHPEEASETASPISDTTLFEDAPVCQVSPLGCGEDTRAYIAYDDTMRKEMPATHAPQAKEYETTPVVRRHVRHRRYVSSDSPFDVAETPSIPLRSRAKTNDGLLLLRTNPSREPTTNFPKSRPGHRISLNLPVNARTNQLDGAQRLQQPDNRVWTEPPAYIKFAQHTTTADVWTSEERDLEYKHRHTFIGTGSLDDFLEILDISAVHTTSKSAVARAFVQLASAEQLYARQCSTGKNGWDLVTRTTLNVMDVTSVDYVVQLQVKLGSIPLRQFLDLIPFDEVDEIAAMHVVEAFSVASHMDATAGVGTRSKARAFRSWLVEQMKTDADL